MKVADNKFERIAIGLMFGAGTAVAAVAVGYIAHYDLGLSRLEVRTHSLVIACLLAVLLAVDYYGKKLRKPK
jgi:hypothetical protein